jgi:hypothetical protein
MVLLAFGLIGGFLSGLVGIGGGIIMVPALVYFLGYTQHFSQGTVLFMFLIPIGFLGVYNYHQTDNIDLKSAAIMATTFVVGSYFGSKLALSIDQLTLKRIFGVVLFLVSIKMFFYSK